MMLCEKINIEEEANKIQNNTYDLLNRRIEDIKELNRLSSEEICSHIRVLKENILSEICNNDKVKVYVKTR